MSEYSSYDIKQLFAMVTAAKQTLGQSHEQIQAWTRAQQMLDRHWTALQGFRTQLAAKWPPDQNAASAAYLLELDRLLNAVTQTAQAAISNAIQIGYVTEAITQAHTTLETLHREYVDNEAKIDRYNNMVDAVGTGASAVHGPLGGFVAKGITKAVTSSPVDDGRQDQLQQQARQAMDTLSGAAHDASVNMTTPPDYMPPDVAVDPGDTSLGNSSTGGGAQRPPTIDPPAHTRAHLTAPGHVESGAGGNGDTATGTGSHPAPGDAGAPSGGASQPPARGTGLQLAGVITPVPPPPTPLPPPVTGPPTLPGPTPIPPVPGIAPLPGFTSGGRVAVNPTTAGGTRVVGTSGGAGGRALPPGGRIEGVTGLPQQRGGQLGGSRAGVQRVNPVGGVIGAQRGNSVGGGVGAQRGNPVGGVTSTQRGNSVGRGIGAQRGPSGSGVPLPANSGVTGMARGRRSGGSDPDHGRQWDPDNPWAVIEGVAPVIEPDPADTVDPGPGIIGLHR
ncbi:hypothetical protein AB0M36_37150 [Actinoplanes sp. NPDC051346]|uniref:hypothetical protein n=1 Tax=Actinoplanes sp. NPDC051346 TaxID=3155048 RepID=UPI0034313160